jgi:hypothetical protein
MNKKPSLSQMADDKYRIRLDESWHHERPKVRRESPLADKCRNPWPNYLNHTKKRLPPLVAVRHKCLDCCCESAAEVKLCPATTCPLWPFRFGKFPEDHAGAKSVLKPINLKCRDCAPEVIKGKPDGRTATRSAVRSIAYDLGRILADQAADPKVVAQATLNRPDVGVSLGLTGLKSIKLFQARLRAQGWEEERVMVMFMVVTSNLVAIWSQRLKNA